MKRFAAATLATVLFASTAQAVVFINKIHINPPTSDSTYELVEFMGTPGKSLDGYGLAVIYGGIQKNYPIGSEAEPPSEIDEFFSLDGLSLGDNGILVLVRGSEAFHGSILSDSNFVSNWASIWNGSAETVSGLENDGSLTIMLVRNRPGATEADPGNPAGLLWVKDGKNDADLDSPYEDPPSSGMFFDRWGDGSIDQGGMDPVGNTLNDFRGSSTPGDLSDDLEVVDEVSYEDEAGWEYDLDDRNVDSNSVSVGLPPRRVHALDDPQGFNPDCLMRVDYRTKGPGWAPAGGGAGQMSNGNNWQDTATEQWVRGDTVIGSGGVPAGAGVQFFFSNLPEVNPDALQPYETNVPLWLNDGIAPDFDFSAPNKVQVLAGRVNPLAITFIPGDSDRDGDCDADDLAKTAAVFGDDNWIFSNSYGAAPEDDKGDPATQTRPWDVDATGDNGIEASDLQWTLNFMANTNGHIVGVQYDSTTPAGDGVVLNSNAGTACTVTASAVAARGVPVNSFGDLIEFTVSGQVTAGADATSGEENGIMQFVHDVAISAGGVVRVEAITPQGPFATTRSAIQALQGTDGDLGVLNVNGYTTSFTEGVSAPAEMYTVTLRVIGPGVADVSVAPAGEAKFAASTPEGLKIGHTDTFGNPASSSYPSAIQIIGGVAGDDDGDGDVDVYDFLNFPACMTGPGGGLLPGCGVYDFDTDNDVDLVDYSTFAMTAS